MAPIRRPEGDPEPIYGENSDKFSLEINHGGFFVGNGVNRTYVDGKSMWFDNCDMGMFAHSLLEHVVEMIGYEVAGRVLVYWLLPGKHLSDNALMLINKPEHSLEMWDSVYCGSRYLHIYLDHENSINGYDWDDVVACPIATLPDVLSPRKMVYLEKTPEKFPEQFYSNVIGETARTRAIAKKKLTLEISDSEDDSDSDYGVHLEDSDLDIKDGDDDLYDDNIDEDEVAVNSKKGKKDKKADMDEDQNSDKKGKAKLVDDEDEMVALDSDDEVVSWESENEDDVKFNFQTFETEDMTDPKFHIGQIFPDVDVLRKAIKEYSCRNRVNITFYKNDRKRIGAKCEEGCSWYIWASYDSRTKAILVKTHNAKHSCSKQWKVKAFTYKYLAEKYIESFRADDKMSLKNFARVVQLEWNLSPGRYKLGRARRLAMQMIYGDEIAQYKMLWDYGYELRKTNPGSTFYIGVDSHSRFKNCYFSFDACKRGFLAACRPVICIDGCHLKTRFGGVLLTAIGIDPNDCIYPVAMAVVAVENTEEWRWFLSALKVDLQIENTSSWTIMSDKQKGLINAVNEIFPHSEHRFCVRHMVQNFQRQFKGDVMRIQVWKCAKSSTLAHFEENMAEMKAISEEAHAWLDELDPKTWVKAFQSEFPKCDLLLNNTCEVFNKYILDAREMPILSMIERIKGQCMTRIYNKQQEAQKWSGTVCPKIKKLLMKYTENANTCYAMPAGEQIFEVQCNGYTHCVDMKARTCTCRRWDLSGIPCRHAISCCRHERIAPETMVNSCYSIEKFCKAYENIIIPCSDRRNWERKCIFEILAPPMIKKKGRIAKNRRKQPEEVQADKGIKLTKAGVVMHCSYCKKPGHNKKGCNDAKLGLKPKLQENRQVRAHPESDEDQDQPVEKVHRIIGLNRVRNEYDQEQLTEMLEQTVQSQRSQNYEPLPSSQFIEAHVDNLQPIPSSTNIKVSNLERKIHALRQAKMKAVQGIREVADQAKFDAVMRELEEAEQKKKEELEKKAAAAEARKVAAEEKKLAAEEAKKKAAEARRVAAEEKNKLAALKKEVAAQKRKEAAEKKKEAAERKEAAQVAAFARRSAAAGPSAPPAKKSKKSSILHDYLNGV